MIPDMVDVIKALWRALFAGVLFAALVLYSFARRKRAREENETIKPLFVDRFPFPLLLILGATPWYLLPVPVAIGLIKVNPRRKKGNPDQEE